MESVTLGIVTELRLTGKTPDGAYISLTDNDGVEYTLRISDTLRATVNQPRLMAVRTHDGESISVKEVQARLRAGESIESVARDANWTIEKVERFAGPIQQERAYTLSLAHEVIVRKENGRDPVTFFDLVTSRLAPRDVEMSSVEWNCWRLEDSSWVIRISFPNRDGIGIADWNFDLARKVLSALDDSARWISGDDSAQNQRATSDHGLIYGNHPAARLTQYNRPLESRPLESRPLENNEGPRLVSLREVPDADAAKDGVTGRAKVPSWDEIMFGGSRKDIPSLQRDSERDLEE
jgi:hypothetical protein